MARRVLVHWPQGFIGNPHVAPTCSLTEFAQTSCPVDSQVGKVVIGFLRARKSTCRSTTWSPARTRRVLAFTAPLLGLPGHARTSSSRTNSDYGLEADQSDTLRLPFNHYRVVLWGVPAAEENDVDRFFTPLTGVAACYIGIFGPEVVGCPPAFRSSAPRMHRRQFRGRRSCRTRPICGVPLIVRADVEILRRRKKHIEKQSPEMTGCSQASFSPSVLVKPTTENRKPRAVWTRSSRFHRPRARSPLRPRS